MLLLQLRHMVHVTAKAAVTHYFLCHKVTKACRGFDGQVALGFFAQKLVRYRKLIHPRNNCFVTLFVPNHPTPRVTYIKLLPSHICSVNANNNESANVQPIL